MKTHKTTIVMWLGLIAACIAPISAHCAGHNHSGVIGQALGFFCIQFRVGEPPTLCPPGALPLPATIFAYSEDYKLVGQVETDEQGYFEIFLKPGNYWLLPSPHGPYVALSATSVSVAKKEFTPIVMLYPLGSKSGL